MKKAGPAVLPGLPVEGAEEEDDDEEIPLDDFDTMKVRTSYAGSDTEPTDKKFDDGSESSDDES